MPFLGWMYDIAREQFPSEDFLDDVLLRSGEAGFGVVGFYLEHRFAYPSAPWAAAPGSLTSMTVARLQKRHPSLRLVPFLNTLGHMEGFIRSEGGQWLAEAPGQRVLQSCPSRPECREFASALVEDAIEAFSDEWVHIGGDETHQLGVCPRCAEREKHVGKAGLYGEFYGRLCSEVLAKGRRPCLWGDMLAKYPEALDSLPRETVIFDWQYDTPPGEAAQLFRTHGFDVVCCPALRTYDASWCYLDQTERIIDGHAEAAKRLGALGVLVCAWEFFGFSTFSSVFPLTLATGLHLTKGKTWYEALDAAGGPGFVDAVDILGRRIPALSSFLAPGTWRKLRENLVLQGNPFFLWKRWRGEACGREGDEILKACGETERLLPASSPLRFSVDLHRMAVEWVRRVEVAYGHYRAGEPAMSADVLEKGAGLLLSLRPYLETVAREGGSTADLARLGNLLDVVALVCDRLRALPAGEGWRPAFETITHHAWVAGDQASWPAEI